MQTQLGGGGDASTCLLPWEGGAILLVERGLCQVQSRRNRGGSACQCPGLCIPSSAPVTLSFLPCSSVPAPEALDSSVSVVDWSRKAGLGLDNLGDLVGA